MHPNARLAFGVEFELLLKPKQMFAEQLENICPGWAAKFEKAKKSQSQTPAHEETATNTNAAKAEAEALRQEFRQLVAEFLTSAANTPTVATSSGYLTWSVVDEPALDEVSGYCRLELISRAISSDNEWQEEFDQVFAALDLWCDMIRTTGCSMHVHVSPSAEPKVKEDQWAHGHLNKIMKALSYFTIPVNKIMPAERKNNPYAMPNMLSDGVAEKRPDLRAAYKLVEAESWKPLFDIYDSEMKKPLHRTMAFRIMGECRQVAWNFAHVITDCGTIEFRQCPGITASAAAKHWASFTLGFIYAAAFQTNMDWTQIGVKKTHPSVEDLDSFTRVGSGGLEVESQGALMRLEEDTSEMKVRTAPELAKMLEKNLPSYTG